MRYPVNTICILCIYLRNDRNCQRSHLQSAAQNWHGTTILPESDHLKLPPLLHIFGMYWLLLFSCSSLANDGALHLHARQPLDGLKFQLDAPTKAWAQEKRTLVVGVQEDNYPPYRIITTLNELEGIAADYLSALQRELSMDLTLRRFATTQALYEALREGQIDLVAVATDADARHYQVQLSPPYAFTELAVFTEAGDLRDFDMQANAMQFAGVDEQLIALYRQSGGQADRQTLPAIGHGATQCQRS